MSIDKAGLQRLSLLDYPGMTSAVLFLPGCDFRCPFCHNAGLVLGGQESELVDMKDAFSYLEARRGKMDAVCVSGGEPLMNGEDEVSELLARIRDLGFRVKLDTNGSFPEKLSGLLSAGLLDYVAMDIKNQPLKYAETAGVPGLDVSKISESIQLLLGAGIEFEFRTTVMHPYHEISDFERIGRWIEGAPAYYLQGFIDSGNIIKRAHIRAFTEEEMKGALAAALVYVPSARLRGT